MSDKRLLIPAGRFLMMLGRWLLNLFMYIGLSFGFLYGEQTPLVKLRVMSKKFTVLRLVRMVMRRPKGLKTLMKSFLVLSASLPVTFLKTASPSSLYRPMLAASYLLANSFKINAPTSSQTSAPS